MSSNRNPNGWVILVVALVLVLTGSSIFVASRQQRTQAEARIVEQVEKQFAAQFLHQLIRQKDLSVEEVRRQVLADLPTLVQLTPQAVRKLIDGRIRTLAKDARATPLDRARAALAIADFDGVLTEEGQQRTASREMAILAGTAALSKFRQQPQLKWNERALDAFQCALALSDAHVEPLAWVDAANWTASVLCDLARFAEAEPLLREALQIREARLGLHHPAIANALDYLAWFLTNTNRLAEAEPLLRRALTIDEQNYGAKHTDVATRLNNLAQFFKTTNRLKEAEPLMRRALMIDEQIYGAEHPNVAVHLNNLARLLHVTNRIAESELLLRRALAIYEQSYGTECSGVALVLNNLAQLLQQTNRIAVAEPLMRRTLAIDEQFYGAEHPDVAIALNNLALLLWITNRRAEAVPLMCHALTIDEQFYGTEHSKVADDLYNLAQFLDETDRLAKVEPLLCRALVIAFRRRPGDEDPNYQWHRQQYARVLQDMKVSEVEIAQRLKDAMATVGPLKPIASEFERLLGPAQPVADVLTALDRQYKAEDKPLIYFLRLDQPIAPHLDELLGRSKLDVPLNEPIVPHLEKLLGPAKSPQEVFETLDRQYREQNKSAIWFLPLSQPIAPHLDELLGPLPK